MSTAPHMHPVAIAWQEWLQSSQGTNCNQPGFIPKQFLENRLYLAFQAGAKAGHDDAKAQSFKLIDSTIEEFRKVKETL